ncbi:MAG: hypothetical protein JWQ81_3958 [Amycolatopsis sp.]|uniref:hypothetical protein n=1 Tax=Amycolatopsis sp. TaxID=37632 RepID=UPI0026064107|nr:hypothetical protein [Amycolatopsis sp.]MCU1683219.1 hypothetical protein [Amycolatopsis sp.]
MDEGELDQLRDDVDQLLRVQEDFYGPGERDQLRKEVRELTERLADVESVVTDLERKLDRVQRRSARVTGMEVVDLDGVGAETRRLAEVAETLPTMRTELLDEFARAKLERAAAAAAQWLAHYDAELEAALELSEYLSSTPAILMAAKGRPGRVTEFRNIHESLLGMNLDRTGVAEDENRARAALLADDATRERIEPRLRAAHQSARALRERLRASVNAAVSEDCLLPKWIEETLGIPPSDPTQWIERATEVLAYRVTYRVADPLDPLGPARDATQSPPRELWHRWLIDAMYQRGVFQPPAWL